MSATGLLIQEFANRKAYRPLRFLGASGQLGYGIPTPAFEAGLARTVEWYAKFSGNWDNVESALVAHPRRGFSGKAWTGKPDEEASAGGGGSGGGGGGH